jgi:cell division protein FtsW (lipid II flippase)
VDLARPPHNYDRRRHRPLDERLRLIAAKQQRNLRGLLIVTRVGSFVGAAFFAAMVLTAWWGFLQLRASFAQFSSPTPAPLMFNPLKLIGGELLVLAVVSIWVLIRGVLVGLGAARFYQQEYRRAWQLLEHNWVGPVFAEEEYWRPIYASRQRALVKRRFGEFSKSLEDHLNFGAHFLEALEDLAHGPGRMRYYSSYQGYVRTASARMRWMIWVMPAYILLVGGIGSAPIVASGQPWSWLLFPGVVVLAALLTLIMLAQMGPQLLLERARISALCEFLLDEPQLERDKLEAPLETGSRLRQRWLAVYERVAWWCGWRGAEL